MSTRASALRPWEPLEPLDDIIDDIIAAGVQKYLVIHVGVDPLLEDAGRRGSRKGMLGIRRYDPVSSRGEQEGWQR